MANAPKKTEIEDDVVGMVNRISQEKAAQRAKAEQKKEQEQLPYSLREAHRMISMLRKLEDKRAMVGDVIKMAVAQSYKDDPPHIEVPAKPKVSRKKDVEIPCLHLSDLHFGKHTQTYNSEVAAERLMLIAEKVCHITNIRRQGAAINEIRVYLGGDVVEGERIFEKQILHIDQGVFEQAVRTTPVVMSRFLLRLLQDFPKVHVKCVAGNHGRVEPNRKAPRHPLTDWDRVSYEITKMILLGADEFATPKQRELARRLTFEIPETWYFVDRVFDWGNLVVHGHEIRGGFAGFPWYGTAKKAWGWNDVIPELERIHERLGHWDYLWFGHFHTMANFVLNYKTVLANGTLESHNAYAAQELAAAGPGCQRLAFFDADLGLISDNPVFVETPEPALRRALAPFKDRIVGEEWRGL